METREWLEGTLTRTGASQVMVSRIVCPVVGLEGPIQRAIQPKLLLRNNSLPTCSLDRAVMPP